MALFTCPECGHSQAVDDKHIGKTATCPQCKAQGLVSRTEDLPEKALDSGGEEPSIRRSQGGPLGIDLLLENKDS